MKLFLILILAGMAVVSIWLILGFALGSPFDVLSKPVTAYLSGIDFSGFLANPLSLLTVGGTAVTAITGLWYKINQYKTQAETLKAQATAQVNQLQTAASEATGKLSTATASIESLTKTNTDLAGKVASIEPLVNQLKEQLTNKENTIQTLQRSLSADVISSLPAGSKILNPDGTVKLEVIKNVIVP